MTLRRNLAAGLAVVAVLAGTSFCQDHASRLEKRAIATAKQTLVSHLDPELPAEPLGTWLPKALGTRSIDWESNDCGEQTGDPRTTPADPPLCAQAHVMFIDGREVTVSLAVGTAKRGVFGKPALAYITFQTPQGDILEVHELHRLRELMDVSPADWARRKKP